MRDKVPEPLPPSVGIRGLIVTLHRGLAWSPGFWAIDKPTEVFVSLMPERVDKCVTSVMNDNPDMDESRAYAICQAQENEGNLSELSFDADLQDEDPCWDGYIAVGMKPDPNGDGKVPNCVPEEDVDEANLSAQRHVLSQRSLAGPIEREEQSDGSVVYRNLKIISRGVWTDAESQKPIEYVPENLSLGDERTVNLIHDDDNDVSAVGEIVEDSYYTENGAGYADVKLHLDNAASEYADENLQKTLETKGEKGFGGPSIEIPAEGQEIDFSQDPPATEKALIDGLGLVAQPAARTVSFAQQTREQGVALSANSQTDKALYLQEADMSADTEEERELAQTMEEAKEMMREMGYEDSEMSLEDMEEEDMMEMAREMAELMENMKGEEDDMEEEDMEMAMDEEDVLDLIQEEMDDLWGELDELKEQMDMAADSEELSEATEEIESELSALKEEKEELAEENKQLSERLETLEEQPDNTNRTLAEGNNTDDGEDKEYSAISPSQYRGY